MRFEHTIGLVVSTIFVFTILLIIFLPINKPIISQQIIDNKTYSCKLYSDNITSCEQLPPLNIKIINGTKYNCVEYRLLFSNPVLKCEVLNK